MSKTLVTICFCVFIAASTVAAAESVSTYMGNSQRSGYADKTLPENCSVWWEYVQKHPPKPAWPPSHRAQARIKFDYASQVAIGYGKVCFGSTVDNTIHALDANTGQSVWAFCTEGPVRFVPVFFNGCIYVVSDDGFLYCLR